MENHKADVKDKAANPSHTEAVKPKVSSLKAFKQRIAPQRNFEDRKKHKVPTSAASQVPGHEAGSGSCVQLHGDEGGYELKGQVAGPCVGPAPAREKPHSPVPPPRREPAARFPQRELQLQTLCQRPATSREEAARPQ